MTKIHRADQVIAVRGRKRIKGGVTCTRCGHERFKFMRVCPRCEDTVMRELDTSTKENVG